MSRMNNENLIRYTQNLKNYINSAASVQVDWNQENEEARDYLKNKPNVLVNSELDQKFFELVY